MLGIVVIKKRICELLARLPSTPDAHGRVLRTELALAVARLPEPARSVYLLSARDNFTDAVIAARLCLTVGQVERELAHALAMLDRDDAVVTNSAAVASDRSSG